MSERFNNGFLMAPAGAVLEFPADRISHRIIKLSGQRTVNSCNIAISDVDGDGLDEIAIPFNIGEADFVRLYRGDGAMIWENADVRFYHARYNDPEKTPFDLCHIWYKSAHRHLLTEIFDIDRDGQKEVIVGDGPIYILDGTTGKIKNTLDLGGLCALWNCVYDPGRDQNIVVATITRPRDSADTGEVVGIAADGTILWRLKTPGNIFADCMRHGDLNGDGRPELGFSMGRRDVVAQFWIIDCDGKLLWKKHVPTELGNDSHVDDFTITRVLPENDPIRGLQVALVCGPNILDKDGGVVWRKEEDGNLYDHMQKIIVADLFPEKPGREVYGVESFRRKSHLFSAYGERLWTYDNYTCLCDGVPFGRLTTAGALLDWSGGGAFEFAQPEFSPFPIAGTYRKRPTKCNLAELANREDCFMRFMHVIDRHGKPVDIFPITDVPMCALAARATGAKTDDIVMVGHFDSSIHIFTRR